MIKFFRKIRFDLIEKNKTGKYLKYAIGEIVLVVIGILIALQINNWNENRKQQSKIKSVYSVIKSDLKYDVEKFDKIIKNMSIADTIFKKVIEKKMTNEDYQNCSSCRYILSGYQDVEIEKGGLKLLIDDSVLFESQSDSLFVKISNFYSYFETEITASQKEMNTNFYDTWLYWKKNKSWYADFNNGVKNDEMILYMLNSWNYRNEVSAAYSLQYLVYLNQLKEYKKNALIVIEDINKRTE